MGDDLGPVAIPLVLIAVCLVLAALVTGSAVDGASEFMRAAGL